MGFFSFLTQEIAIDLGTANLVIMQNDKVVVDEPSIIAIDRYSGSMVALGSEARAMIGKTPDNIKVVRPLRNGVIADFNAAELMIKGMINMMSKPSRFFAPSLKMVVCIPSGSTEVEMRAVRDSSERAGGREVYLIYEPMAAAIGIGLEVNDPKGCMVIDIGGGTTEIAVISLGGIVCDNSIRVAGDDFTSDIQQFMRSQHNLKIGDKTAEDIKIAVGAATPSIDNPPEDYMVCGPNIVSSLPLEVAISYQEIAYCLDKNLMKIEAAVLEILEQTPPELYADIVNSGIYLTGGGALLRGLDKRLSEKLKIPFNVADDPLRAVARGTGEVLKNIDKYKFLMK